MNNTLKQLPEENLIYNEKNNIIPLETQHGFKTNVYNILNNSSLGKMGTIENSYIKVLKYLMNNGKIENIKIIFELYDIKDKDSFTKLIKNKKWEEIKDLIQFGKTENIKIIFELYDILNFEDFEKLLNDKESENIKLFFIYGYSQNIKKIFELYKSQTFENFGKNKNFDEISNLIIFGNPKNIEKIFELYNIQNKNDFEKLLSTKMWNKIKILVENGTPENIEKIFELYNIQNVENFEKLLNDERWGEIKILVENGTPENIEKIFELYNIQNKNDFERLLNNEKWNDLKILIENGIPENIEKIVYCFSNGFTYNNLSMDDESMKKVLFTVESFGSEIFDELLKLMKAQPNKDLYQIMRENVGNKFGKITDKLTQYEQEDIKNNGTKISKLQETKNSDKQNEIIKNLNLSSNKLELSIYIRYSYTVDYPEIAEYIIIFLEKYIKERYSKYISSIRIIPRKKGIFPRSDLFTGKDNILTKYDITGNDFITALKKYSIPFHLSFSNYIDTEELPHVVSGGMRNKKGKNVIKLGFELEELLDNNSTEKKSLDNVLNGLVKTMQTLDKKLDKILVILMGVCNKLCK